MKLPQLKSIMTPFPYCVGLNTTLEQARQSMDEHDIRHLPITDAGELVGIVSDRDLKAASSLAQDKHQSLTINDIYIPDAYIVDLNEPLDNVLLEMAEKHIGSAIVTRKGRLAGVLTGRDVCFSFGEYLRKKKPATGGNDVA